MFRPPIEITEALILRSAERTLNSLSKLYIHEVIEKSIPEQSRSGQVNANCAKIVGAGEKQRHFSRSWPEPEHQ
jgi:hypothetical protein